MDDLLNGLLGLVLLLIIVALVLALPIMLLWNWLMPIIFGLTTIDFWQALGMAILSGCLFRGNNGGGKK